VLQAFLLAVAMSELCRAALAPLPDLGAVVSPGALPAPGAGPGLEPVRQPALGETNFS
jgi:hypothetical protein